ncbi:hypothetical protein DSCA_40620 [Desulfosarcina alkanivorans]|uniref:Pyruvate formate-lyase activating enzyme n=1 Tax=Desulfosarcina alkanivorans TaxID=571177 RepID=A0A5K7YKA8_9BACT|nr:DUF1786 family protein [Desulfosarcina alkanivorans]BBO70132.1 hypothetical protein DSCA_40620 [Desulfosarcina alkanivorans]
MARYLMLDIGAGTLDMLYYDTEHDLHYKAVVRSPVRVLADEIRQTRGALVVTGTEMGGGPVSQALIDRAGSADVVMSRDAAATIHHDDRRVMARGIRVVDAAETDGLVNDSRFSHIITGDLQPDRLRRLVQGMGVPFEFDAVAVCAQDHGVAPPGVSHLDFRHRMFTAALDRHPVPQALLYRSDQVPEAMNRLSAIAGQARALPTDRVYVMDSGMAAILGASKDVLAANAKRMLVLDIATSHTVGAAMDAGRLCGFFEYHTSDITAARLDGLLADLPDGKLSHRQILEEGGHGAYHCRAFGYDAVDLILATGPRRAMALASSLPVVFGAPWGDNMMTGTVGLMEAVRLREGLPPITYL